MERGQGGRVEKISDAPTMKVLMWLLLEIMVFLKYIEDPKCYMFLESSQKMLIEYQHDNVQIHGHGHEYVHLLV